MLTREQRDQFDAQGFMRLPRAFAPDAAAAMEARVWRTLEHRLGVAREDPGSWPRGAIDGLQGLKREAVFDAIGGPALTDALDDLLGREAWVRPRDWGQMLVSFPSAGGSRARSPWHTDFEFSGPADRPFGALVFSYLSDVPPGAGGTVVVAGSHRVIRRFLESRPTRLRRPMRDLRHALMRSDEWLVALTNQEIAGELDLAALRGKADVAGEAVELVELGGAAGDVVIGHPWLLHRGAPNRGSRPRMMRVQRIQTVRAAES